MTTIVFTTTGSTSSYVPVMSQTSTSQTDTSSSQSNVPPTSSASILPSRMSVTQTKRFEAGTAVGGLVFLVLIGFFVWYLIRRCLFRHCFQGRRTRNQPEIGDGPTSQIINLGPTSNPYMPVETDRRSDTTIPTNTSRYSNPPGIPPIPHPYAVPESSSRPTSPPPPYPPSAERRRRSANMVDASPFLDDMGASLSNTIPAQYDTARRSFPRMTGENDQGYTVPRRPVRRNEI